MQVRTLVHITSYLIRYLVTYLPTCRPQSCSPHPLGACWWVARMLISDDRATDEGCGLGQVAWDLCTRRPPSILAGVLGAVPVLWLGV